MMEGLYTKIYFYLNLFGALFSQTTISGEAIKIEE
jgi:hypothetical protein